MSGNYSMFSGITTGLMSTYSVLSNATGGKITQSSILTAQSNTSYAASINPTFASYIQTNFATLDTNHDGILEASELSNMTNMMNTAGFTAAQLSQLGPAAGLSGNELSQVLEHFRDIDVNGDGKVTASEIQAYKLSSAMQKEKTEFANKAAANQSVFYGNDNASSTADSSSMLSFKYWNDGSNSSS